MIQQLLFFLLACSSIYADAPKWALDNSDKGWSDDTLVFKYFHNSELQRQWAWELIGKHPLKGNERVLDFGCGDGKITAELSHCLPQGQIIGVDLSKQMITFAKRTFPNSYYPSLSFVKIDDVDFEQKNLNLPDKFDRIYSFCAFHLVKNPCEVLINLQKKIIDGGKLIIVSPTGGNPAFFEAARRAFIDFDLLPLWTKSSTTKITMRTAEGIKSIFKSSKWKILDLSEMNSPYVFITRKQFSDWLIGTVTANWDVPIDMAPEFMDKLIDYMLEIDSNIIDDKGSYHFRSSRMHIVATPI